MKKPQPTRVTNERNKMNDEHVENITMPDGSVWLQLGEIRKYKPYPNSAPETEFRKDRRIFIKLDEIVSVGSGEERIKGSQAEDDTRAAVVLSGGETINVETNITETMEIIQAATKRPRVEYENSKHIVTRKEQK